MSEVLIYELDDPDNLRPRYVGKTSTSLKKRLNSHISVARRQRGNGRPLYDWIRSLLKENKKPVAQVIEEVDRGDWRKAERYWICWFRSEYGYFQIFNILGGGRSGPPEGIEFSEKRNQKISESLQDYYKNNPGPWSGKQHTEEWKERMSEIMQGNKNAVGNKSRTEQKRGEEELRKVSEAVSGENHPLYGTKRSKGTREKISQQKRALTKDQADTIRNRRDESGVDLAEKFDVSPQTIYNIWNEEYY